MKTPDYVKAWGSPREILENLEKVLHDNGYGGFIKVSTDFVEEILIPLFEEMMEEEYESAGSL